MDSGNKNPKLKAKYQQFDLIQFFEIRSFKVNRNIVWKLKIFGGLKCIVRSY